MNNKLILMTAIATTFLQSCSIMTPIGKEDFACPNEQKGGVCAGPRTIYELTNSRQNLENLSEEDDFDGYVIDQDEDGNTVAVKHNGKKASKGQRHNEHEHPEQLANVSPSQYHPREHSQQGKDNYQPPQVMEQIRSTARASDQYQQWPTTTEPLAPEPLSVLEPPKVMRILLNTFKDDAQNLHIPGYIYAQVEQERWSVGEAASMRPQRVVPTHVREKAERERVSRKARQAGVSALEHQENGG
jgi:conjugal transfer pilus assembly protein TraV